MTRTSIAMAVLAAASFAARAETFTAAGEGGTAPKDYVPALVSNGEISLCVDYTGMVTPDPKFHWWPDVSAANVWWQGRRKSGPIADLFPFGNFTAELKVDGAACASPARWSQSLDTHRATTRYRNEYANGLVCEGSVFVPKGRRAVVVRRRFRADRAICVDYAETYRMTPDERMVFTAAPDRICVRTYGKRVSDAEVYATCSDGDFAFVAGAAALKRSFALAAGETKTLDIIYSYADNRFFEGAERGAFGAPGKTEADALRSRGYDALAAEHEADWARYWDVCRIVTPEVSLNRMADAAQYMLRSNVSHWGFPVGINRACWSGRYFAFDEMFQAQAMAATGHFAESVKCGEYRKRVLHHALRRAAHYGRIEKYGAWLFWEMDEDGDCENCPPGFWEMHIFNHSTVTRSVWEHYNYTGDEKFLRETAYPVILAMARYFHNFWVYDAPGGGKYIGKATCLERLGPARDRPFLTTCGAIDTLRIAAQAAEILGCADAETATFAKEAELLVQSLPVKDGAYTVDGEAAQSSIALLGGLFPFPVLPADDPAQRNAAQVILANVLKYGNMYPVGKKVCPWYAGFISAAMSRLGEADTAVRVLLDAAAMQGAMGEIWEINEEEVRKQPNFATASGNCLYALTRLFVTEFEGHVELFRGVPAHWRDYAFKLPMPGGAVADVEVKSGRLVHFKIDAAAGVKSPRFRLPKSVAAGFDFGRGAKVIAQDGAVWVSFD